ncbi:MAG: DegT/DnrJ/EryC1/StrS family aminotransferase [Candidatus Peribacteraceae bacterium]|nr:DegT/DnrJ/EryC1/StrS family aminotransferase [Candidatus Peribacteraceae bacterium]
MALTALTSHLPGDKRQKTGDEVVTVTAGFPTTTVNPIAQNQLVPVFLDIMLPTYNVDITQLQAGKQTRHAPSAEPRMR